ncbi:MAG: hypothetical protein IJU98_12005, partial [Synergistaceae bacterium]|nr:hypothetical protein [Synergistaceae bacterium]
MRSRVRISASTLRGATISALVTLFFLGVIIAYYLMLTSETRQRIIKSCELVAATSSQEINAYISTGIYAMRMTCYRLDNMIRDGWSKDEIANFIVNQSIAIESITSGKSTGLYAYINGEYLDGSGWTPNPGYDPTKRPWYIDARANNGQIAVVDPYLEERTNTVMISLSKTLGDGRSVVGMDFSMDRLQSITEDLAARNDTAMEIILDRKYQVIAHSDRAGLGKNYLEEDGTFGQALVSAMRSQDDSYFSFSFGGANYIAYKAPVADDWLCLSVFDSTSVFHRLRNLLLFTIATSVLVVSVLSLILGYSNRKARLARELQLNEKAERAAAANEAKSAFLASMSHEIRTPINAVLGMNEMIIRESRDKRVTTYARNVESAGKNLLSLINDILDFSKIEAGKMEIVEADYRLSSVLNDVTNMILFKAKQKSLDFHVDVDESLPDGLFGDPVRVRQVVVNILNNAVKYT